MSKITSIQIQKTASSPPDIDSDFGDRDKVIKYLIETYGEDHVFCVGNTNYYSLKSAIRSLTPVYKISGAEKNAMSKIFNENLSIEENIENSETIKKFFRDHPEIKEHVPRLANCIDAFATHAGGIVVTDKKFPASKYFPLRRDEGNNAVVTSLCDKEEVEFLGGVKIDVLGLNNCVQVHHCKELTGYDPYTLYPKNVKEVYEDVVLSVKYRNIFQFSSDQGRKALEHIRPVSLSDLAATSGAIRLLVNEIGREFYDKFVINIQQYQIGNKTYWEDDLGEQIQENFNFQVCKMLLRDTYGILIYQEQLISMVQRLSKGAKTYQDGNDVRKALDKKINGKYGSLDQVLKSSLDIQRQWHKDIMKIFDEYLLPYLGKDGYDSPDPIIQSFLKGEFDDDGRLIVPKHGIIGMIISCSAYLFSILHATAYSVTTYEQMYQKHFYPCHFWLSALNVGDKSKINEYVRGIRAETDVKILRPDINYSFEDFTLEKNDTRIRFGLKYVAKMDLVSKVIIDEREANGNYTSLQNFLDRMKQTKCNKSSLESLFSANAFYNLPLRDGEEPCKDIVMIAEYLQNNSTAFVGESLPVTPVVLSVNEFLALGTDISFVHPLIEEIDSAWAIEEIPNNSTKIIIARVESVKDKKTKKGKMVKELKITCLKSMVEKTVYCWNMDYKASKGEVRKIKIKNNDGFLNVDFFVSRWKK